MERRRKEGEKEKAMTPQISIQRVSYLLLILSEFSIGSLRL